ncbi:MAG: peptide chain release factor 2 [Oscillospiraceae bacterium]|jgi:peptide chain release factor 2|nr:peptide chain release factor 2 [Oscillospiraceae bacterium]
MLQLDDLKQKYGNVKVQMIELRDHIKDEPLRNNLKTREEQILKEGFWDDKSNSKKVLSEIKALKSKITTLENLQEADDELEIMFEFAKEEHTEATLTELSAKLTVFEKDVTTFKLETLLTEKYDQHNAILTFHAGAGGTEAEDWVQMLYRMYSMWCADHQFSIKVLGCLAGSECGIKSASMLVHGENAYGFLKSEMGVHRLVRISPFDASGRRHTSFASLEVIPELDESCEVKIDEKDLKIDTFRASGAGGQHVNKTESAVRITHLKTGIVTFCQNERSQHQNKETAMKLLIAKLIQIKEKEQLEHIEDIKGKQSEIAWGSQIRSYVFMPYTLVKDHRTGFETGSVSAVMDGNLDGFIMAYLKKLPASGLLLTCSNVDST